MPETRTLHIISHTHWDREWYETFQQFRLRLVKLVDELLDLLESDPAFLYFMLDGQTIVLEDYLLMRPENEARLRAQIRAGRLLIGPWHILPDMFLPGPEAHIRNLLEGTRTCRDFDSRMAVGYMPDSFGHIGQMPQILRGFGLQSACLWRGLDEEPAEFWWQSPDGSRVLLANLRDSYSNGAWLPGDPPADPQGIDPFAAGLAELGESLASHSAVPHQLIMLGTDHMQPSQYTAANIARANAILPGLHIEHSTLPRYLAAIQPALAGLNLPVVTGELRQSRRMHLLPGVLSTRIWIKQRSTAAEELLTRWVEPYTAFAELLETGGPRLRRPQGLTRQAWRLLMENHPHDSICGCGIDQLHEEMKTRFDQVDQIGAELTRQSLEALSTRINTASAPGQPALASLVVFNPSSAARTDLVTVEVNPGPGGLEGFALLDDRGRELPYETLGMGARELLNTVMNIKDFRAAFASVHDGRAIGLGVRTFSLVRNGQTVSIDITLAEGEPDQKLWRQGAAQVNNLLEDPTVTSFQVRAHTPEIVRLVFSARDVPAHGWRTFHLAARPVPTAPMRIPALISAALPFISRVSSHPLVQRTAALPATRRLLARLRSSRPGSTIENEFFRVTLEPTGTIHLLDKRTGQAYPGLNRFVDNGDAGDEYNYSPPAANPHFTARLLQATIQHGPVRQSLRIELQLEIPAALSPDRQSRARELIKLPITTTIHLTAGLERIDIHTSLENHARDHRLRVHFPAPFRVEQAEHDGHFEIVQRPLGVPEFDRQSWAEDPRPEVPQRAFTRLTASGGAGGLTIANRGLPEVEAQRTASGSGIAITLLRCVGWLSRDDLQTRRGHAGPGLETPAAQMLNEPGLGPRTWEFDYAVIPHGSQPPSAAAHLAWGFNAPLRAIATPAHPGHLPATGAYLSLNGTDASHFHIEAVKLTADGSALIVRGCNPGPGELQLSLATSLPLPRAELSNLAEEPGSPLYPDPHGAFPFQAGPYQVVTLRLTHA